MAAERTVSVNIDIEAGAAYLRLGHGQVGRTVEFDEDIYVALGALSADSSMRNLAAPYRRAHQTRRRDWRTSTQGA